MSKKLSGKIALITGGSRGIGKAVATALAEDGATIAISYSNSAARAEELIKELTAKGVTAKAFKADQADSKQVEQLVNNVVKDFGKIDILVNNAGVFTGWPVDSADNNVAELDRQLAVNLKAVAIAIRATVKHMGKGGRIVNIGSTLGDRSPFAGIADYSATKAAVAAYTRGYARDLGPKEITINTIQPGPINTEMNPDEGDFAAIQKAGTALGRYGKPEEVAAAVKFLASPEASYITGATLTVDGGFNA